jgi:DedD protein
VPAPAPAPAPAAPQRDNAEAARAQAILQGKTPPAAATERVVVQVGAYADEARARDTRQKLERAGLKTYVHVAQTAEGRRVRVRVGPFDNRADAEKAAARVKALGLPAAILTL